MDTNQLIAGIKALVESGDMDVAELREMLSLVDQVEEYDRNSGLERIFVPGSAYSLDNCPKHKAAIKATKTYRETVVCGGNRCIAKGTLVATPKGPVPIEELKVGDEVKAMAGPPVRVVKTWDNGHAELVSIYEQCTGTLLATCTPNHEIRCHENGVWGKKAVKDFTADTQVCIRKSAYFVAYMNVVLKPAGTGHVYDITVDNDDHLFQLESGLIVSNSGKSFLGCYISSVLLTGLYPDDWEGIHFDGPVETWSMGVTAQTTKETLQKILLGPIGSFGTGLIPKRCIGPHKMSAVAGAVDSIQIKHASGRWSELGFKAYKQDTPSMYGAKKHWIHMDEPAPELLYSEVVIRTVFEKGEVQGATIYTMTPKDGMTRLLINIISNSDFPAGRKGIPDVRMLKKLADMAAEEEENE